MKLLIVTQNVDRQDPILGFFRRWILEFAKRCDEVIVIGQGAGDDAFPSNVTVFSLGKERGSSRAAQVLRFWRLLWVLRRRYDAVLVHMTPVWVVLGWKMLFLLRKPVYLWYEVRRGGWMLRLATAFSRRVFSATPHGLPFRSLKNEVIGHGVDTDMFSPEGERDHRLIVAVGRITRIKRVDAILSAFISLPPDEHLFIAGGTITRDDESYLRELEAFIAKHGLRRRIETCFLPHEELPALYRRCALFLHGGGGGLDKALLEAMSCACPVVTLSEAAAGMLPERCVATVETFGAKAKALLALSGEEREKLGNELREIVLRDHSLPVLIGKLTAEMGK